MSSRRLPLLLGVLGACLVTSCVGDGAAPAGVAQGSADTGFVDTSFVDGGLVDSGATVETLAVELPSEADVAQSVIPECVGGGSGDGCACTKNTDCSSGFCVPTADGGRCTKTCLDDCWTGWKCTAVSNTGTDTTFICMDETLTLCRPCETAADCAIGAGTGFACIDYGPTEGRFCGMACGDGDTCPSGYVCSTDHLPLDGATAAQCQPISGTCACSAYATQQAATTSCSATAAGVGTCTGLRRCELAGQPPTPCSAITPALETCDGVDNDCSGQTDEGTFPCNTVNQFGSCAGTASCTGGALGTCSAAAATAESCDGADDNCDGVIDDGFPDPDDDGRASCIDNCPAKANSDQADADADMVGDACDPCPLPTDGDADGDALCDSKDNCPSDVNPLQDDSDEDGRGDMCDGCPSDALDDVDGDTVCGELDNCPAIANAAQADLDSDGLGDACDSCKSDAKNDADGDTVCGDVDNCPTIANQSQVDTDSDGIGQVCDACPADPLGDLDGDGVCGDVDNCPKDNNESQNDLDGDGFGDVCDLCPTEFTNDEDKDGRCALQDNCPKVSNPEQLDADDDGIGDACDPCLGDPKNDSDKDGVCEGKDNCPGLANGSQQDLDTDGIGDACDPDRDGDGDPNTTDCAPADMEVHHGAVEVCDGVDGNCDGLTDPGADFTDGVACTTDQCDASSGVVSHTPVDAVCDDGLACTADSCAPATGCVTGPQSGTPCSDGNPCTLVDTCLAGVCKGGALETCDDGNECTVDSCDASAITAEKCLHQPIDDSACAPDAFACTSDVCVAGVCQHPIASACVIDGACVAAGAKDPSSSCRTCQPDVSTAAYSLLPAEAACDDDGLSCTDDQCDAAGTCEHRLVATACRIAVGGLATCFAAQESNPTNDCQWCDPSASASAWSNTPESSACASDTNPCTTDTCDGGGTCVHDAGNAGAACADDGNPCTTDLCDGTTTTCRHAATACSCGGVACPTLSGYGTACNAQSACEYTPTDMTAWRAWDVWIYVPPGTFSMGEAGLPTAAQATPIHSVTLDRGFFVAKYEIVTAEYEACQAAGTCSAPSTADYMGCDGAGVNTSAKGRGNHPQNGITWQQAKDFCGWVGTGGRLPSEAEWEYAAGGPADRAYPWGDAPEPTCANGTLTFDPGGSCGCGTQTTSIAGSKAAGASPFGALDVAGNLFEWVEDCWHDSYSGAPANGSAWTTGCSGANRISRGGSYGHPALYSRVAARAGDVPYNRNAMYGARCVRPLTCVIGGVTYVAGARDPADMCQTCQPGLSQTAWTAGACLWEETFDNAPDWSNKWTRTDSGAPVVTYTPGNLAVHAGNGSSTGIGASFTSKEWMTGSQFTYEVRLFHAGWGRTGVYAQNSTVSPAWSVGLVLDTDDTNYLAFGTYSSAGSVGTDWKFAGTPYMNRWVTVRIVVANQTAQFYADGVLLDTLPVSTPPPAIQLLIGAASISWKSGANDSSFSHVKYTSSK